MYKNRLSALNNYISWAIELFKMNLSRCFCKGSLKNHNKSIIRKFTSSKPLYEASSKTTQPQIKEEKYDFEDLKVIERPERRKPPIPPFMKDVFLSVFNKELLAFPEVLNKEEMLELDNRVAQLQAITKNNEISPKEKSLSFKNIGLYGAPMKITEGGYSMNCTERIRYLETLSPNYQLTKVLSDHWVGLKSLQIGLEPDKLSQISYELVRGDIPLTICVREKYPENVNQPDLRTYAKLQGNDVWYIVGEKYCRNSSGYMIALCAVEETRLNAFLVHPKANGVQVKGDLVKFNDTPVTPLNLSEEKLSSILSLSRLDSAVQAYGLLKDLLYNISKHVRGKFISGEPLADLPLLKSRMADAVMSLYTAESMCYFTAGLLDGYEAPDVDMESALCRLYSIEHSLESIVRLIDGLGIDGLDKEWRGYLDKIMYLAVQDDVQDTLHIYTALLGLRHAGMQMAGEVKQMRNPLFHPSFIVKKMFENRFQEADRPKLTLFLEENLHPSLKQSAQNLEYSVLRMRYASELLLSRHGAQVGERHCDLKRLSQAAGDILAMTAVLARASRAYCIGVRNSDVDMKMAATIVEGKRQSVSRLIKEIDDDEYLNLDHFRNDFGKKFLDKCEVPFMPATEKVYW